MVEQREKKTNLGLGIISVLVGVGFFFLLVWQRTDYSILMVVAISVLMCGGVFISGRLGEAMSDAEEARDRAFGFVDKIQGRKNG